MEKPLASQPLRPNPSAGRLGWGLTALALAFWAGLLWFLGRTLDQLIPAVLALDPVALGLTLALAPSALHLAQAFFYRPRGPAEPPADSPAFLWSRLFTGPLVFLPAPGHPRLETGPAFFAVATPGDQARLRAAAEARLKAAGPARRLALLLEARSPLDLALAGLAARAWFPFSALARLAGLLMSPSRRLMRLWGYAFFLAWRAWDDPGPADELTTYKRRLALDLDRRGRALAPPEAAAEGEAAAIDRLIRLRAALARLYRHPGYGARVGEALPEAEPAEDWSEKLAPHLAPRYRGVFLDLPVTL
ncbi:MAG: hypothetical protein LBV21_06980, partial [Candidatus Adiutrix sp.]|nr:hypothetical protein [Candidatus Adiutrix sp.]